MRAIYDAIAEFHSATCLRFVRRLNEDKYIKFFHLRGCWSYVGVRRRGVNWVGVGQVFVIIKSILSLSVSVVQLSLGDGCNEKGIVIHELMHAIGFWHEHTRPDRDQHIKILWENIQPGNQHNRHGERTASPEDEGAVVRKPVILFDVNTAW